MATGKVEICGLDTSRLPVLSQESMREMIEKAQAGDKDARRELIQGNLRLVLSVFRTAETMWTICFRWAASGL